MRVSRFVLALFALVLAGCSGNSPTRSASSPPTIRIAFLPSDDGRSRVAFYEVVRAAIEKSTGLPATAVKVTDYSGVIEALRNNKAEVGFFGPLSYVLARKETGVECFAAGVSKARPEGTYHSIIAVRVDSPYKKLADLKGKTIALVDPASTSGALMPRYMVWKETGMNLEDFFGRVVYTGTHPTALKALAAKTVEVAAVEEGLQPIMEKNGSLKTGVIRELTRSQELPPSPWAYRKDLSPELKKKIAAGVLGIKDMPATTENMGLTSFRPVSDKEFEVVQQLVDQLKVQREAILKK